MTTLELQQAYRRELAFMRFWRVFSWVASTAIAVTIVGAASYFMPPWMLLP